MSTANPAQPEMLAEKKGVGKFLSKIKTLLKRKSTKGPENASQAPVIATASPHVAPSEPAPADPLPNTEAPAQHVEPVEPAELTTTYAHGPQTVKIWRSQIDAERAKRLGDRFRLAAELEEWRKSRPDKEITRVEKPIRMRIHRNCHLCNTIFGRSRTCTCGHNRCKLCPRYPLKKDKSAPREAADALATSGYIEVDDFASMTDNHILTIPSRTGGQVLVRKKPVQRVRRTCHECSALFKSGAKICTLCNHRRCADCPRDPAKKKYYPDGYPGDAPSATSTTPIKYNCHKCNKTFPPVPHPRSPEGIALGDTIEPLECSRCSHERCTQCLRAPPRKVEPAPDPEVVRSLEAKLAELRLRHSPMDV